MIILHFAIPTLSRRNEGLSNLVEGNPENYVHVLRYTSVMAEIRLGIMLKLGKIYEEDWYHLLVKLTIKLHGIKLVGA